MFTYDGYNFHYNLLMSDVYQYDAFIFSLYGEEQWFILPFIFALIDRWHAAIWKWNGEYATN